MLNENQQINTGAGSIQAHNIVMLQMDPALASLAESQMQSNFFRITGILCNRATREIMEWLMQHHGFTFRELACAWKRHALLTKGSGELVRANKWYDYTFAAVSISFLLMFSMAGLSFLMRVKPSQETWAITAFLWAVVTGGLLGSIGIISTWVWPQRIAKRAMQALCER